MPNGQLLLCCALAIVSAFATQDFPPNYIEYNSLTALADASICPTTTCPAGFTGHYCDQLLCPSRGTVPSRSRSMLDEAAYKTCDETQRLAVDSHVTRLFILVDALQQGSNPQLTVIDAKGAPLAPTQVLTNNTAAIEIEYPVPNYGVYYATFRAGNPCHFEAHGESDVSVSSGFTANRHDDNPTTYAPQYTLSYFVSHVNNMPFPGRAGVVSIYENAALLYTFRLNDRYGCAFDQISEAPVICQSISTYWFKVFGRDENGYEFERVDNIDCQSLVTTTATSTPSTTTTTRGTGTTTTSQCLNGGYPTGGGGCFCQSGWTGPTCGTIVCQNGGTPGQGKCACTLQYSGTHCEYAECKAKNPLPPYSYSARSLVFVVQNTRDMEDELMMLKTYISEVIDELYLHHNGFLTSYGLVVVNDQYDSIAYTGGDINMFQQAVHRLFVDSRTQACNKPVLAAVQTALKLSAPNGYIYVLTNSGSSDPSGTILDIYSRIERQTLSVNMIISPSYCGTVDVKKSYADIVQFSGGQFFSPGSSRTTASLLRTIPSAFMRARVDEKRFSDCTVEKDVYVPVDGHQASMTVTVDGYLAQVRVYNPTGASHFHDSIVSDNNIKIVQAITPCPRGWSQNGRGCYQASLTPATWQVAKQNCANMGAHLVNILNEGKQTYLNFNARGVNYWTGLNDQMTEGQFMWDGPMALSLDSYYTNWAPNEPSSDPSHQRNCVWLQHTLNNGSIVAAQWYTGSCGSQLPYICQKYSFDSVSNRIPAGYWRVSISTQPNPATGDKTCFAKITAQTDLQIQIGYDPHRFTDFPLSTPSQNGSNYAMVNVNVAAPAHVDIIDFLDLTPSHIGYTRMNPRANCYFQFVSDAFNCPATYFTSALFGHDDGGYAYRRLVDTMCLRTAGDWADYVDNKMWTTRQLTRI